MEERAAIMKEWTKYKQKQNAQQLLAIKMFMESQQKALNELRAESEELYQQALEVIRPLSSSSTH